MSKPDVATQLAEGNTFLDILPPEIRNKIFKYVLKPYNGSIYLKRVTKNPPFQYSTKGCYGTIKISLAFQRTCRQIYHETKDLIWSYNTLAYCGNIFSNMSYYLSEVPNVIKKNLRSIQIEWEYFEPGYRFELQSLVSFQSLEEIIIITPEEGFIEFVELDGYDQFDGIGIYEGIKTMLRDAFQGSGEGDSFRNGYLSHLKRSIYFYCNMGMFEDDGRPTCIFTLDYGGPDLMMREVAGVFGGKVFFNNQLRYEDGKLAKGVPEDLVVPAELDESEDLFFVEDLALLYFAKNEVEVEVEDLGIFCNSVSGEINGKGLWGRPSRLDDFLHLIGDGNREDGVKWLRTFYKQHFDGSGIWIT